MPLGNTYDDQACAIARTLEVVGERWTLLILRDAFHGLTRFEEFQRSLGVAANVLSARLKKLVEVGVLERERHERHPRRFRYRLTAKGIALHPVLIAMMQWGDRFAPGPAGPEVVLVHAGCGRETEPSLACPHCGEAVSIQNLDLRPGPGTRAPDGGPAELTPPQQAAWGR